MISVLTIGPTANSKSFRLLNQCPEVLRILVYTFCVFAVMDHGANCGDLTGSRTLRPKDTSAPQNWCRSLSRIAGGAVSHRNCPGSKCPGFSSITAVVSKCLETGAEVSQSVLMPKYLVAEVAGNHLTSLLL